jgi:hypothetical protein
VEDTLRVHAGYRVIILTERGGELRVKEMHMDTQELAEWIDARICSQCRQGYTCDDWECEQARKIADMLRKMVPFTGRDVSGQDVSGWLIPE